jgi:hypothetical protein
MTDEDLMATRYGQLLRAVQCAYRKHHLEDESIGWNALDDMLETVLAECMGDRVFQQWLSDHTLRIFNGYRKSPSRERVTHGSETNTDGRGSHYAGA